MKRLVVLTPLITGTILALGVLLGARLNYPSQPAAFVVQNEKEQKIRQILNMIDYEYVDNVDTDSLLDLTIKDMLHRLDPHSSYIAKEDVARTEENMQGSFEGIGIEFMIYRDTLTVIRPVPEGPAEKEGVKAGDRIISVDKTPIAGVGVQQLELVDLLKGPGNTTVEVKIFRPVNSSERTVTITRGSIPINSVEASFMVDSVTGLIKLNRFSERSAEEVRKAIRELKRAGMQKMILDLRDNPGGLLSASRKIADEFLGDDVLIVYTKDRAGAKSYTYASSTGQFEEGDLVVLINENSASASEIVAGALQDNDRATIVGRRSFGKGLVQEEMVLKDGSRIRLTTSRYYTPTGRSIQKPFTDGYEAYINESQERYERGELISKDSIKVNEEQRFLTPGGKVVYGGGGIMPDVFVPIDTAYRSMGWMYHLFGYTPLDRFAFTFVDDHRREFLKVSESDFIENFSVSDSLIDRYLIEQEVTNAKDRINTATMNMAKNRLKALMAKNLFGMGAFYKVIFEEDPMVLRGLRVFHPEEDPDSSSVSDTLKVDNNNP
ncbi:MAG: S41 family peptidase [Bacteroidota bacterium]|nr:S41 family peptidase [Bacteroidota bacterium]MDX5426501.1 S41 family peptidase [Bacteroidota bacterium]MDX5448073.1 S41 family peptidase [Bacteroidota bacterium]MDX5504528.1 S41 family peptidase [Bacteroidota bacterium]